MADEPPKRPRNAAATKARILDAAFDLFAERGYAKAGMRDIAERSDVALSLLIRHFGSKSALFEQALAAALHRRAVFSYDRAAFGSIMTELIEETKDMCIPAAMVLSIADPESLIIAQRVTRQNVIAGLAEWLGPPSADDRAVAMLALMNGYILQTRYLSPGETSQQLRAWFARALQDIVDNRMD